jgi:hypothetical protein
MLLNTVRAILLFVFYVRAGAERKCHFYVGGDSPVGVTETFASIHAARDAVRNLLRKNGGRLDHDVFVCLSAGMHDVSMQTLSFTDEHAVAPGSMGRIVWRGATDTVVSGGVQLKEWKLTTFNGKPAYVSTVPSTSFGKTLRQLWVGGVRASRVKVEYAPSEGPAVNKCAQSWPAQGAFSCPVWAKQCVGYIPNKQWGHCVKGGGDPFSGGATVNATNIPIMVPWQSADEETFGFAVAPESHIATFPAAWAKTSTSSIELTWPVVVKNWIEPRCTIGSISSDLANITLASPCGKLLYSRMGGKGAKTFTSPVYFEAASGYPLPPGVFFHDRDTNQVFYNPLDGQTVTDLSTDAWVTTKEVLVTYAHASGHTWEHVQFRYSTWLQANTADGFVDTQSAVFSCTPNKEGCPSSGQGEPGGAVQVANSTHLTFQYCSFKNIGSAYGISVWKSSKHITIHANTFQDLSGGFVKLGSIDAAADGANSPDPFNWDAFYTVTHNSASGQAVEYGGAAGLFGGYLFSADLSHNTVSDAGYSGFSVGWGWGRTTCPGYGNNTVSFNKMNNVMAKLKDGGGIYVNGATNPEHGWNTMSNNWVNQDKHVYAVYYLDNGASHWYVTNNVASNSSVAWVYFMTPGTGNPVDAAHNNFVEKMYYENCAAPNNGCEKYNCTVDKASVHEIVPPAQFPPEAVAIMSAAGAMTKRN